MLVIASGEERTALYRFFDADENLLYVGITNEPWRRWREHVLAQPWFPQVKHQAITWYDERVSAELAERTAIRREQPRFNKAHAILPVAVELPEELLPPLATTKAAVPDPFPVPQAELREVELPLKVRLELPPAADLELEVPPDVAPEAVQQDPMPARAPKGWHADPLLNTRRGRRVALLVAACCAWAFLPSFPGMPANWNSPWMVGLVISTVIPVFVIFVIAFAPKLHRLGRWLDTNFGPPRGSPGK